MFEQRVRNACASEFLCMYLLESKKSLRYIYTLNKVFRKNFHFFYFQSSSTDLAIKIAVKTYILFYEIETQSCFIYLIYSVSH